MRIFRSGTYTVAAMLLSAVLATAGEYAGSQIGFGTGLIDLPVSAARTGAVLWESGPSDPINETFTSINFQGQAYGPTVEIQFSLASGESWSQWEPCYVKWFSNGRFWGSFPAGGEPGASIKLRAVSLGEGTGAISIFEMQTYREGVVETRSKSLYFYKSLTELPTALTSGKISVVPRGEWKAAPAKRFYEPMMPLRITIHHTEAVQAITREAAIRELQVIQDYHMSPKGRNFYDIGYQFIIDGAGNVYEGRPEIMVGAHVAGSNEGNIGISLMGRFQPPSTQKPTQKQLEAMTALVRWLAENYGMPAKSVLAHRDQDSTDCPGANLYKYMDALRQAVKTPASAGAALGGIKTFSMSEPDISLNGETQ